MSVSTVVPLNSLPGVRGWLRRLHDDLRAGRSCLWLLPRTQVSGSDCVADALVTELLHEIGEFILLSTSDPNSGDIRAPAETAQPIGSQWSGLAPPLDYDDGMSGFGTSTTVRCPAPARRFTPAESLAELLERLAGQLASPARPQEAEFGADGDPVERLSTDGVLGQLVGAAEGRPETRPVVIRAWREETPTAATNFLRQLVARVKEAGLPPSRRPRALVVATAEDLPADLPDQFARDDIAVHWWWGAIGRLDTATVVAVNRPPTAGLAGRQQLLEAVVQATIIEICGPFLDVAAVLAGHWNGSPETLLGALQLAIAETVVEEVDLPGQRERAGGPGHRPGQLVLTPWSDGLVENWDGRLHCHPAYDVAHGRTVSTRVWLAQHQALLPGLDDAREQFTDVVRRRARMSLPELAVRYGPQHVDVPAEAVTDRDNGRVLSAMELGSMWGAHVNGHISLNEAERRRLRILWLSRNRLAHRTPLDETQLNHLVAELSD